MRLGRYQIGSSRRTLGTDEGFTLLEILVVLAILGFLATIATPPVLRQLAKAKVDAARLQLQSISASIDLYQLDVGKYPSQEEGLAALVTRPTGEAKWNGPYVKRIDSLTDPWGQPFVYKIPGDHGDYDLYSEGSAGSATSVGDRHAVRSWE